MDLSDSIFRIRQRIVDRTVTSAFQARLAREYDIALRQSRTENRVCRDFGANLFERRFNAISFALFARTMPVLPSLPKHFLESCRCSFRIRLCLFVCFLGLGASIKELGVEARPFDFLENSRPSVGIAVLFVFVESREDLGARKLLKRFDPNVVAFDEPIVSFLRGRASS